MSLVVAIEGSLQFGQVGKRAAQDLAVLDIEEAAFDLSFALGAG